MKMPEKHDLLAAILAAKEQGIGQSLRLHGVPSVRIMAVRLQNSNRRNDVRYAQFIRDLSTSPD